MKRVAERLVFAPTDLARFVQNPYVTWMDRLHLESAEQATPDEPTEEFEIISGLGLDHEREFLARLRASGRDVCEVPEGPLEKRALATSAAMREGIEIIYQGALARDSFAGFCDFLVRVDSPSQLGEHGYEVWDTKLAKRARPDFLVQLCCYAEILEGEQGRRPERVVVVTGDGHELAFRTDDFFFYYVKLKEAFLEQQENFDPESRPEPGREGRNGRWEGEAERWREATDHLSRVADIRGDQIAKLVAAGIDSLGRLADAPETKLVPRLREDTFRKLRRQAQLQRDSRALPRPAFEIVPAPDDDPRRGLAILPPSSPLDVAFDIEGYPLVEGGLEYLLGAIVKRENELVFHDWWAHDEAQERRSFEAFVDWVHERWTQDPSMHVYHYAAYEVTAMRRLMGKYGTREREVDDLLRNEVFVDLYKVVHQGLRVGVPSYSLKKIERLYLEAREGDVASAGESIVFYQRWLENPDGASWEDSVILREIRDYNEEDCVSTWKLIDWLRNVQQEAGIDWFPVHDLERPREEKEESESAILARGLLAEIPEDRSSDPERWRTQELLAWLLEFHAREEKPVWWRMFDRRDSSEIQLAEDLDCLAGIRRTDALPRPEKSSTVFEFEYDPAQDTKLRPGKKCYFSHDLTPCEVVTMDAELGRLEMKVGPRALKKLEEAGRGIPARLSLIPNEHVSATAIARSILRIAQTFRETGEIPPALADVFHRRRPRVPSREEGPLAHSGESGLETARAIVPELDSTTLCIQGPPGAGKTYTGATVILDLLAAGKRVGITANSHKAILNLMNKVADLAEERGQTIDAAKVGGDENDPIFERAGVRFVQRASALDDIPVLVGGTAWTFGHESLTGAFDHLFVDEAGQVSLANLAGMCPSASNLVLLGDQMQLGQPIQGSHPGESGLSALEYLLGGHATIPADMGIFLGATWRMHPELCRFVSGAVYEDRLRSMPCTEGRRVVPVEGGRVARGAGIQFVGVEHDANRQGSAEEVEVIRALVDELLASRHTDEHGRDRGLLTLEDILIVAPYNLQVRMLQSALGETARVGTIDRFQGQEAAVVIVSMAASSGDASPRGIEFLFDRNRLNVALSRARSLALVVGNPALARTPCASVKQMSLVNLFCRALLEGECDPTSIAPARSP